MTATDLATKAGAANSAARRPIPPFTAEHEEFRQAVRRFVQTELRPHAREWEDARWFPNEVFGRLAELGYIGLKFPAEYGGDGDPVADAVFVEELAWCGSGGLAAGHRGPRRHRAAADLEVRHRGPEAALSRPWDPRRDDRARWRSPSRTPGSDVASIRTHARRVDGGYIVNGSKMFITGGVRANVLVTAVKTRQEGGHRGLSFLHHRPRPGCRVERDREARLARVRHRAHHVRRRVRA